MAFSHTEAVLAFALKQKERERKERGEGKERNIVGLDLSLLVAQSTH